MAACFTCLEYPSERHRTPKSTNPIERQIVEFRRRLKPMRSPNNLRSAERIVYDLIAYILDPNLMDRPSEEIAQDA
ncbi:MAG TPA: transposase [candidate division Zixibacteria bacterium]|nr:transposase [candidate division Zixibacteria bacterium]MDD4918081.1 transposase [candidate division Zixibacteria bacterium]MDM7972050.1 transposase [candidate division Zixibacteria bacterium]HOZ07496.1 transposase [candidate division Zixibacteria bacterium]HPM37401.1 transposase [candidate division Zixibacteria bacterium]